MNIKYLSKIIKLNIVVTAIAVSVLPLQNALAQSQSSYVPEIGWKSRLSSLGLDREENIGQNYTFYCQSATEDLIHSPIWGTGIYTANSGICSAAIHAGMITTEGGMVTVELRSGQPFYTGSLHNDLLSKDHAGTDIAFMFVGEPIVEDSATVNLSQPERRNTSGVSRVVKNGIQRGVERSIEEAIRDIFR